MVTIRQALESVLGATSADVGCILLHLEKAGFRSDEAAEGVFKHVKAENLPQPAEAAPLTFKQKLILDEAVSSATESSNKPQRKVSRTGLRSRPSATMPVQEVDERKLWDQHVASRPVRAQCLTWDADDPATTSWLPLADDILVEARWLHLRLFEGLNRGDIQGIIEGTGYEPVWHPALLRFFQAAAGGQPGVKYERELESPGDSAREDIRGLIMRPSEGQPPLAPGECKTDFKPSTSDAIFHNGQQDGIAKLFKVCWSKYCGYGRTFICAFAVLFKAIWIVRLRFVGTPDKDLPTPSADSDESVLLGCDVVPHFPSSFEIDQSDPCLLCPDTLTLLKTEPSIHDLSELLLESGFRRGSFRATPGFHLLVRSVLGQCKLWGLQAVETLVLKLDTGASWGLRKPECEVVAMGARSLVLRRQAADNFVIKVGAKETIEMEAKIHDRVDGKRCPHIRSLELDEHGWGMRGTVHGAGDGLAFMCLAEFCTGSLEPHHVASPVRFQEFFTQAQQALHVLHENGILHRDLKADNMLLTSNGKLLLNDFDVSTFKDDKRGLKALVGNDYCRSPFFEQNHVSNKTDYTIRDDRMGLVLAFLQLRGRTGSSFKDKYALLTAAKRDKDCPPEMQQWIKDAGL
ncbi:Protein kinase-like domain containing protein [Klebsormidium nitens]|uniref:Protein kinase-like domain containing protein n=1 Tax=Klebsormidium nitens TaxID=105231 RepID=A0A1Y1I462_KLENI|nr:Protein kinase-like domain containing protein [Klebsormidium nitens]|eukprot:GAQ83537.1 Protein kinase-like domain containing protein [Klebsormidium nitens]